MWCGGIIMGVGLFVLFDKEIAGADAFSNETDGKAVAAATGLLDEVCREKRLTQFTHFIVDDEELYERAVELAEGEMLDMETSFDPANGLRTVSGLIKALKSEEQWASRKRPGDRRPHRDRKKEIEGVVACLQLLEHDLKIAKKKKVRFSLGFS
jgi:hypothetical protein